MVESNEKVVSEQQLDTFKSYASAFGIQGSVVITQDQFMLTSVKLDRDRFSKIVELYGDYDKISGISVSDYEKILFDYVAGNGINGDLISLFDFMNDQEEILKAKGIEL